MSVDVGRGRGIRQATTFLLTDIEGSTRRWEADPDRMAELLEAHDAAIETEVGKAGGELIKARGEGDSTFSVFSNAPAALRAALACQVRLIAHVGLPVRMALHTDVVNRRWGDYYGPPVNRVARLRSLAAGGRVLLSSNTAAGVRSQLPPDCRLVDLGVFVLKDLERPERVFGVSHSALPTVLVPRDSVLAADLVGRDTELSVLRALLGAAGRSTLRLAVVIGEGGIGKTRLAEVVGREACAEGGRLIWVTARGDLGAPPLSVWVDLLKRLTDSDAVGRPHDVSGAHAAGQAPDRDVIYDRIIAGLRLASDDHLVLVVLDDLHLADPSSVQLLRRLGAERGLDRVMLLAMSRPMPSDHPTRQVLAHLEGADHAITVRLGELSDPECTSLLTVIAPELDPTAAAGIVRHAGGNPLFVRAYATAMTQRTGTTQMPESVRVAIGERLSTLGPTAIGVLQVAAVAGRSIALDITVAAAGVDDGEVLHALAVAETAGLVSRAAVTVQAWRFTHEVIRDAIVAGFEPAERAAAHGRVGRIIERLRADDLEAHAAEIATHLSRATPDHWPSAVAYGEMAARAALRVGAFEEAAGHSQRALNQLTEMGGGAAQRARLLLLLGSALTADDMEASGNAILDAIAIARANEDQDLLLKAALTLPHDAGRLDARAVAELHTVVEQLDATEPAVAARLHGHLAFHHFTARNWDDLQREADEAWRLSRGINDPATRFLGSLGRLLSMWCDPDREAQKLVLDECTRASETCADPAVVLQGRYMRMRPLIEFADRNGFNTTLRLLEEGVGGHVATYSRWVATTWRTLEATLDGEFDQAESLLEQSAALGEAAAGPHSLAVQFHQKSMLRFEQDRLAEEVEALASVDSIWPDNRVVAGWMALAQVSAGDHRRARAILATVDDDDFARVPAQHCFALAPLTETAIALGDEAVATRISMAMAPRAGNLFVGFGIASTCYGAVDRYLGLISTLRGDHDAAVNQHAAASRLHRRFGSRLWMLHSQLDTAAGLAGRGRSGDVERARALVNDVGEEAASTQMARVSRRAAELGRLLA